MNAYIDHDRHFVAVDVIILGFDKEALKLLCIQRDFEPGRGDWSLMGGFLKSGEGLDSAASRVLFQLTGLKDIYLEQLHTYGDPLRDPAERVISVAYYALINPEKFGAEINGSIYAKWFQLHEQPDLIFDHRMMVERAIGRLQRRCRTQPVGFELLPKQFTLPQLMRLYEVIFKRSFDPRNFRKKILSFDVLKKLEVKDMEGSRKGAFLYEFDEEKYDELIENGMSFEL